MGKSLRPNPYPPGWNFQQISPQTPNARPRAWESGQQPFETGGTSIQDQGQKTAVANPARVASSSFIKSRERLRPYQCFTCPTPPQTFTKTPIKFSMPSISTFKCSSLGSDTRNKESVSSTAISS